MLHAITTYFNPCGYERSRANYARFRDALRGCALHTIELSFTGEWAIEDAIHVRGGAQNLMWQKERLINLVVASLPPEVTKVAWIDGDLLFLNPRWAELAERGLDDVPVLQLFQNIHFLGPHGTVIRSQPSFAAMLCNDSDGRNSPGGAWAARRDVFPIYDRAAIGGGDRLLVESWRGNWKATLHKMNDAWANDWIQFGSNPVVDGHIGFVVGDVLHCWHGRYEHRNYVDRWLCLTEHAFDPRADVVVDEQGLLSWSSDKPEMHRQVADYFHERREDG